MTDGIRKFHIHDTTVNPPILKGTVQVRANQSETHEEAATRRGRELIGHENFSVTEVAPETGPQKVARMMSNFFGQHAKDW